jgi:hypothetical protein
MTSKKDFTDQEWTRIRRAPLVAGFAISLADPGGPIEAAKETMASLRSATLPPSQEELLASVALDVQALAQQKQNPLGDFKPRSGQQVLEELRGVNEIVTAKASPQEMKAFRRWLVAAAQAAADAAKEGGFMGFGAEQVSAVSSRCWTACAPRLVWPNGRGRAWVGITLHLDRPPRRGTTTLAEVGKGLDLQPCLNRCLIK